MDKRILKKLENIHKRLWRLRNIQAKRGLHGLSQRDLDMILDAYVGDYRYKKIYIERLFNYSLIWYTEGEKPRKYYIINPSEVEYDSEKLLDRELNRMEEEATKEGKSREG